MKTIYNLTAVIIFSLLHSCVQETHLKTISLKVDMSKLDTIHKPGVRGQFTSPSWQETILLTDHNNDSIYEATIKVESAQSGLEFKFLNNEDYELNGQDNRFIQFKYKPQTLIYECQYNVPEGTQLEIN